MHIGVLEDDPDQQDFIRQCLGDEDSRISAFARASQFERAMREDAFDLLIIDWHLPDASGMDVLAQLRQHHGWSGPILFITASDGEDDVVTALERGADDFLAKPLRPAELRARIAALGRRAGLRTSASKERIGPFELNHEQRCIALSEREVKLTDREFRLASLFFTQLGQLFSRGHLLELIWGISADVTTRTVDTHVSRLRQKLELDGRHGLRLRSVYQHGYRLEQQ
ncbi:response regulator transcription factor [Halomonas sp. HP20-15]|uniref:response regulator transcription factor n=1 Tax=Halomonas sp. HP20-15 TaxID=3085901 RepID=UPI002980AB49|nr:response regulator transcription factor [Halomonas sp. HP20-15]MDW5377659.1 response regulator transcription factor [Halomonas sp. HP20-15]